MIMRVNRVSDDLRCEWKRRKQRHKFMILHRQSKWTSIWFALSRCFPGIWKKTKKKQAALQIVQPNQEVIWSSFLFPRRSPYQKLLTPKSPTAFPLDTRAPSGNPEQNSIYVPQRTGSFRFLPSTHRPNLLTMTPLFTANTHNALCIRDVRNRGCQFNKETTFKHNLTCRKINMLRFSAVSVIVSLIPEE